MWHIVLQYYTKQTCLNYITSTGAVPQDDNLMETLRRPKDFVHVALQHGKDHEELARVQFTTEHKKQVSNLVKYFSLYLQDLA